MLLAFFTCSLLHINTLYSFRFVYIWDTVIAKLVYKLPGHLGSVNDVDFHPNEPISKCCVVCSLAVLSVVLSNFVRCHAVSQQNGIVSIWYMYT